MIAAICGLKREAEIAAGPDVVTLVSGGNTKLLRERLERVSAAIEGVISFGIAGALSPQLKPGDCVIASAVIAGGRCFETNAQWSARLMARLPAAKFVPFAGSDKVVMTGAEKALLFDATQANALDMESHAAAEFAAKRGLPFAALRTIADTAMSDLPACAVVALTPEGEINLPAVLWSILKQPQQVSATIRMGRESKAAFAALLRCRGLLGDRLLGPDLL